MVALITLYVNILKILIANTRFETEEKAIKFCNYVNKNFFHSISAVTNGCSVDMPPAGVSKTTGILEYAKHIANSKIYTIGDNINDIDMIKAFNGIAVSNAKEEVKKQAKYQADRVADAIEFVIND